MKMACHDDRRTGKIHDAEYRTRQGGRIVSHPTVPSVFLVKKESNAEVRKHYQLAFRERLKHLVWFNFASAFSSVVLWMKTGRFSNDSLNIPLQIMPNEEYN